MARSVYATFCKDVNDAIRKLEKEGTSEDDVKEGELAVQEYTDAYSKKIDEIFEQKDKEIMTV